MNNFSPRLTAPSETNRLWISTTKGGLNRAIVIDNETGSVLPNCVGYSWGRAYEIIGTAPDLPYWLNGGEWYSYNTSYRKSSSTPKLGSIICYEGGNLGGHVANVEEILSEDLIRTSNSAYNGSRFWLEYVYRSNGVWYRPVTGYTTQGFIYLPDPTPREGLPFWLLKKISDRNRGVY